MFAVIVVVVGFRNDDFWAVVFWRVFFYEKKIL